MSHIIFLIDMNSFFVSCELIRSPQYKKKPLVIASRGKRSVICAASYMAKDLGIDSATPLQSALMKYPNLIVIPPDFTYYQAASRKIMHFLRQFSDIVKVSSIDEAYIDVSHYFKDTEITQAKILQLAKYIQVRLLKEVGFPCNIGISQNRFLAKMASELRKPFVIETIFVSEIDAKLWPLPIGKMYGIGKKSAQLLRYLNIKTIGEFASFENDILLEKLLGKSILERQNLARGLYGELDEQLSVVDVRKSISQSRTFTEDVLEQFILETKIVELFQIIITALQQKNLKIRNVKVSYRTPDFQTMQRSFTFTDYTNDEQIIQQKMIELFLSLWDGEAVRLVGVGVMDFISVTQHAEQLSLFELNSTQMNRKIQQEKKASVLAIVNRSYTLISAKELIKQTEEIEDGS